MTENIIKKHLKVGLVKIFCFVLLVINHMNIVMVNLRFHILDIKTKIHAKIFIVSLKAKNTLKVNVIYLNGLKIKKKLQMQFLKDGYLKLIKDQILCSNIKVDNV